MPEMDGYELARRIREAESGGGEAAVVLAFTANTLREAADECQAAGMDDVLTKPIELKELKAKLEHWLPLRSVAERGEPAAGRRLHEAESATDTSLTGSSARARRGHGLLRDALREQQPEAVARAAHRIKGAARMYGDGALADAAAKLEEAARGGAWQVTETAARRVDGETERLFARTGWSTRSRRA